MLLEILITYFCRSGCSTVINNATNTSNPGVNGLDRRILNYDKYLKVKKDNESK